MKALDGCFFRLRFKEPSGKKLRTGLKHKRLAASSYAKAAVSSVSKTPRDCLWLLKLVYAFHYLPYRKTPVKTEYLLDIVPCIPLDYI